MISVILCGGAGSRLWPVSRELHPKPFLRLADGQSLIQKAFLHGAGLPEVKEILTVTNKELRLKVDEEFKSTRLQSALHYILEPFGRNTGPAIAGAALETKRRHGEETVMLILPADHLIADQPAFNAAVAQAVQLARQDFLVTFGIKPIRPETAYGYIEADGSQVRRFVEKPDQATALEYVDTGNFFWNAGIFCVKAATVLSELATYAPELLTGVEACLAASYRRAGTQKCETGNLELDAETFAAIPNISIDYAVMEKSKRVAMVPCDIGWNDLGSWETLCALNPADQDGNHISDPHRAVLHNVANCDIQTQERLVAALGVENLLIVDTPDALLVADKKNVQDVKLIYNRLKDEDHEAYKHHRTVYRPWGSFTLLETGPRFKIKRIELKPGASISLQLHHHRSEHWIVVSGMAEVTCDDKVFFLDTNESTYIKAGHRHRVANRGIIVLVMIEVQSGDYLGEDDIVRFDDIYGRIE